MTEAPPAQMRTIITAVAAHFGLRINDLLSPRRAREIVRPRLVIYWLARRHTRCSLPQIGRLIGGRDHTTVLHGMNQIEIYAVADPKLRADMDVLDGVIAGTRAGNLAVLGGPDLPDPLKAAIDVYTQGGRAKPSDEQIAAMARYLVGRALLSGDLMIDGDEPATEAEPEPVPADVGGALRPLVATLIERRKDLVRSLFTRRERPARDAFEDALNALQTLIEPDFQPEETYQ